MNCLHCISLIFLCSGNSLGNYQSLSSLDTKAHSLQARGGDLISHWRRSSGLKLASSLGLGGCVCGWKVLCSLDWGWRQCKCCSTSSSRSRHFPDRLQTTQGGGGETACLFPLQTSWAWGWRLQKEHLKENCMLHLPQRLHICKTLLGVLFSPRHLCCSFWKLLPNPLHFSGSHSPGFHMAELHAIVPALFGHFLDRTFLFQKSCICVFWS